MKKIMLQIAALVPLLALAGCCSSLAKQNVLSAINTGIGLTVAQNPQTQFYEAKLGYVRSQFYSVPTGKTLASDCCVKCGGKEAVAGSCPINNDADKAVELLAGIRVHSGIDNLLIGADITESFAIGKEAVKSPAAIAMYITQAETKEHAKQAAMASPYAAAVQMQITNQNARIEKTIQWLYGAGQTPDAAKIQTLIVNTRFAGQPNLFTGLSPDQLRRKLQNEWRMDFDALWNNVPPQP